MSNRTKAAQQDVELDMTPMIDCVFLLMIFFVLVIDLSQRELEDLILPKAEYAVPDTEPPADRPVINILQDGTMIWKRNVYYDPDVHGNNFASLQPMLQRWRDELADEVHTETVGGGMTMTVVEDPVLVRADKWTEWHYVGKFMQQCTNQNAAFPNLELALSEVDKEKKALQKQSSP